MKVLLNNLNFPYFGAKSKDVRKADDIQRHTKASFPMISPTYAEEYYLCIKEDSKNRKRADELIKNIWSSVSLQRNLSGLSAQFGIFNRFDTDDNICHMKDLSWIKEWRIGCCDECAKAALAVLCANGFYNSAESCLWCRAQFISKKSGNVEYANEAIVPHCFVVTDLNNNPNILDPRKDIVIDPWLGFADYKSAALARFKQAFSVDIDEIKENLREDFVKKKKLKGEPCNLNDYEVKTSFVFKIHDYKSKSYLKELGKQVREKYPETVLDVEA